MRCDDEIRVLAACSGGGHWEQMMLLRPAFGQFNMFYATTIAGLAERDGVSLCAVLPDTNRSTPFAAVRTWLAAWRTVRSVRPHVVISTGALPGLLCIVAGWMTGARTLWIDSVANTEKLSMSGKWARWFATRRMVQWDHLASPPLLVYDGSIL